MLCKDIINIIEEKYDKTYAMSWDNVGLLAGRYDKEVKKIYIALDATDEVVNAAIECGADMLVTHHPLVMSGLKKVTDGDFIGRRLILLIQNDISYYAMHTNYDVRGMADLAGEKLEFTNAQVLEVTGVSKENTEVQEGIGRIAVCSKPITLRQCCEMVKEVFSLETVKVFGNLDKMIEKIAVCPGSGKSVISTALQKEADVLVTGDIGHHDGIDAVAQGLAIIDAGHYGLEHIFIKDMEKYISEKISCVDICVADIIHPFTVL